MKKFIFFLIFSAVLLHSQEKNEALFYLTANLGGNFSVTGSSPDRIMKVSGILSGEMSSEKGYYYDLGNSLLPGELSRFSFGSVMAEYFKYTSCRAVFISSRDAALGIDNIYSVSQKSGTKFVSSNMTRKNSPLFPQSDVVETGRRKIAFLGLSSADFIPDSFDKNIFQTGSVKSSDVLKSIIPFLKNKGVTDIVLVSGLDTSENINLMMMYPDISLVIAGSDNPGGVAGMEPRQIEFTSGKKIIFCHNPDGIYKLRLTFEEDTLNVKEFSYVSKERKKTSDAGFAEFSGQIEKWKNFYLREMSGVIHEARTPVVLDDQRAGLFLRDVFNSDISVNENTFTGEKFSGSIKASDLSANLNDTYSVITGYMSGEEIKNLYKNRGNLAITGTDGVNIQENQIEPDREYKTVTTQRVYDRYRDKFGKSGSFKNQWKNLAELILEEKENASKLFSDDFSYLERRFRFVLDYSLSFFVESVSVHKDKNLDVPSGKPEENYKKIGTEDEVNMLLYNRSHSLLLTPYLYYVKEGDDYLQNTIKVSLLYTYNLSPFVKPYNKTVYETRFVKVDGLAPSIIRETAGFNTETKILSLKLGAGFEKKTKDPEDYAYYGLEAILKIKYNLVGRLYYIGSADSFITFRNRNSAENKDDRGYVKTSVENTIEYTVDKNVNVSLKHKWYKYYSREMGESYSNSNLILSLSFSSDFRFR